MTRFSNSTDDAAQAKNAPANITLLTVRQVAALLAISPKKVYALPMRQVRLSERRVRYLMADVLAFIEECRS